MKNEEKIFGLGAGRLYIAPGNTAEEHACSTAYYAGPTREGVTLSYTAKVHEITDYYGNRVRSLRYGERMKIEGEMSRLYPGVIARAIGAPAEENAIAFGGVSGEGRLARVRVTLVCSLPAEAGGGEMRFSMLAGASSGASLSLTGMRDSAVRFSLTAETDDAGFSGRMVLS